MAPEPLLARTDLCFDFQRGTITGGNGQVLGSVRWCRRPGSRLACDLGFFDVAGDPRWWLRPTRRWTWFPDEVLTPDRAVLGVVAPDGLRLGDAVVAELEPRRFRFYLPEWSISGDAGWIGDVVLERRWATGEIRRREMWHLRLSPQAQGPIRYLAAATPYLCWRWYHTN